VAPQRSILLHTYVESFSYAFPNLVYAAAMEPCALCPERKTSLPLIGDWQFLEFGNVAPRNPKLEFVILEGSILPPAPESAGSPPAALDNQMNSAAVEPRALAQQDQTSLSLIGNWQFLEFGNVAPRNPKLELVLT
jgi:hypothetical protein